MWAWTKLGDLNADLLKRPSWLAELLNPRMKQLENEIGQITKVLPSQDIVRTTDATSTPLSSIKIPVDTTVVVSGFVAARRTGGVAGAANDGAGYRVEFAAKNTAGTAALIAAATVTVVGESVGAYNVTVAASGGEIVVSVVGVAATNITWSASFKALSVKE